MEGSNIIGNLLEAIMSNDSSQDKAKKIMESMVAVLKERADLAAGPEPEPEQVVAAMNKLKEGGHVPQNATVEETAKIVVRRLKEMSDKAAEERRNLGIKSREQPMTAEQQERTDRISKLIQSKLPKNGNSNLDADFVAELEERNANMLDPRLEAKYRTVFNLFDLPKDDADRIITLLKLTKTRFTHFASKDAAHHFITTVIGLPTTGKESLVRDAIATVLPLIRI